MSIEELRERRKNLEETSDEILSHMDATILETQRVKSITNDSRTEMDRIEFEFEQFTSLNKTDAAFIFAAVLLQTVRWVAMPELKALKFDELDPEISKTERLGANERSHSGGIYDGLSSGAEYETKALENYRNKQTEKAAESQKEFYKKQNEYRSWIEILTQPVPYDAMNGLDKKNIPNIAGLNKQNANGSFNNIYGNNHHVATLGHDPILGWIFGTANILTSTISFVDFSSYKVIRGHKIKSLASFAESNELQFSDQVIDYSMPECLIDIINNCVASAKEDRKRIPAAVVRQGIHFASDKYCIEGLPIPLLSVINPDEAQRLIEEGWNSVEIEKLVKCDLSQIGISALLDILINIIIESIYMLLLKSDDTKEIKQVKIKKILEIANVISSGSNVLYVALTDNLSKLDLAGIGITLYKLFTTPQFIIDMKQEYLKNEFEKLVLGTE